MLDWLTLSSQGGCWMTLDFENYWKKRIFISLIFFEEIQEKKTTTGTKNKKKNKKLFPLNYLK